MTIYAQIDDEIAERLDAHSKRLFTVKHVLSLLLYSFENEEFDESMVELYGVGDYITGIF